MKGLPAQPPECTSPKGRKENEAHHGSKGMYSLPAAYSSPAMISSFVTYPLQVETVGGAGGGEGGRLAETFAGAPN